MPKQSEIDRMLILFYRSNNAHDFTNFTRPYGWLDKLPMKGLEELEGLLASVRQDVLDEIERRKKAGMPTYARDDHVKKEPWTPGLPN